MDYFAVVINQTVSKRKLNSRDKRVLFLNTQNIALKKLQVMILKNA